MSDVTIANEGRTDLHVLELWGDREAAGNRIAKALGHPLPSAGQAVERLLRIAPNRWLVEGDPGGLVDAAAGDGALTAIGGGTVKFRLSGAGWRSLLMEGGLFDAEGADFAPGSVATTLIDHVTVILRVEGSDACVAYVPASHAADLLSFWNISAGGLLP